MTILRFPHPLLLSGQLFRNTRLRRCRLSECRGACCLHGVWMDPLEMEDILANADLIHPHLAKGRKDPAGWFTDEREEDAFFPSGCLIQTATLPNPAHYGGTECVFLKPDARCSLQTAAVAAGEHPWRWKPFHCIIHPITYEDGSFTIASDEELLAEEASCFRAGTAETRMYESLTEELDFLLSAGSANGDDPKAE
ncbi:MAG: hypothetical protein JW748_09470 [Anaerolineales bacterium]|nr:hypothetical protein [Anaerolineales bacterium]